MSRLTFREMIRTGRRLRCKRSRWRIDWKITGEIDWRWIAVFPTIWLAPWFERCPRQSVIEFHWFAIHIAIGEFNRREDVSMDDV